MGILADAKDSESTYRALVATGTLLVLGEEVIEAARDVYDVRKLASEARERFKGEERVRRVVGEVLASLGSE